MVIGRDPARNAKLADDLRGRTGNDDIRAVAADLGDLDAVRDAAAEILARYDRLDALVHNAGALTSDRRTNPDGIEATVASQVVGPFLLTSLLLERMVESTPARVITTSSGGMYTAELTVDDLQMDTEHYTGTKQYARAKRAQVTLNQLWADRYPDRAVVFHAMHPGWADTPGVEASLPGFRRVMGPLLRTPEQGADTLAWLAADDGDTARDDGRVLARSPHPADPPAPFHPAVGHGSTARRALGLGRRRERRHGGSHVTRVVGRRPCRRARNG